MIDGQFDVPWPPEVNEALAHFVQGSVIRRPPMMFWADPGQTLHRAGLRSDDDDAPLPEDGEEVVIADEDRPEYGVITTQTCDIQDADRPKKPFVHVAPVVPADPSWPESRLKSGQFTTYLHWVPGIADGLWVADLRWQVPVDKGWLLTRKDDVFDGFPDDLARVAFAERLAAQASRRALPDPVVKHIVAPLRGALEKLAKDAGEREQKLDPVTEFALRFAGPELAPTAVQLVALCEAPVPEDVRDWYVEWWSEHVAEHDVGAMVLEPDFQQLAELSASDYRRLVVLDWSHLSPDDEG